MEKELIKLKTSPEIYQVLEEIKQELAEKSEENQQLQEEVAQINRGLLPPTLAPEECVDLEPVDDPHFIPK